MTADDILTERDMLDGGDVVLGWKMPLADNTDALPHKSVAVSEHLLQLIYRQIEKDSCSSFGLV